MFGISNPVHGRYHSSKLERNKELYFDRQYRLQQAEQNRL